MLQHLALAVTGVAVALVVTEGDGGTGHDGGLLLLGAVAAFAVLLALEHRRPALRPGAVLVATAAVLVVAVVVPPQTSRDVWLYAVYGRTVTVHHDSPYTSPPSAHAGDPIVERVEPAYRNTRSLYGPAFVATSAAGAAAAGDSPLGLRLFFQGLAAIAVMAAAVLLHRAGAGTGALAFVGLNPVVAANVVNNAHNDVLVGLGVLGAILLLRRQQARGAALVLGLTCLVKPPAAIAVLAVLLWAWTRDRRLARTIAGVAGTVVVAGYAVAGGPAAVAPLLDAAHHMSRSSVWTALDWWWGVALPAGAIAALAVAAVVVVSGRWSRRPDPAAVTAAALFAYALAAPYVVPWYTVWALPVAALTWRSRLARVIAAHAAALFVAYSLRREMADPLYDGVYALGRIVLPAAAVLLLVLLVLLARRRQATDVLVTR